MLRLFLAFNLLFLNLYACKGGYDSCKQKIIDSNTIVNQNLFIPIENKKKIVFSKQRPNAKIIKHDPFLSLYLVESKKRFKYPFRINTQPLLGIAAVNDKMSLEGKIVKNQVGLNLFAKFNEPLFLPSILTNSCCALEGIVTKKGIIQKEYIKRFLYTKNTAYSDIGIRVKNSKGLVLVSASDPFMKVNPFKKGDRILELDGKKITRASSFMRSILFAKIGSVKTVKIKRGSKTLTFRVKSQKRYGGGFISDTFLEQKGIYFNEAMNITRIEKKFKNYGLHVGDKLIQVNGKRVKNQQELMEYIADFKDYSSLLFERDGFQFFIHVN